MNEFITLKFGNKIKSFLLSIISRRELWIDTIGIIFIVLIMTIIPLSYEQINFVIGRISVVIILFFVLLGLLSFIAIRILKRNLNTPFEKRLLLPTVFRGIVAVVSIWLFSKLMVSFLHPTFSGIDSMELADKAQFYIKIVNGIFFVLYSQVFISVFTGIAETAKTFYKRLLKTWLITVLPISVLSVAFTWLVEWLKSMDIVVAYSVNIVITTFLWVMSIGVNEWIKGEE